MRTPHLTPPVYRTYSSELARFEREKDRMPAGRLDPLTPAMRRIRSFCVQDVFSTGYGILRPGLFRRLTNQAELRARLGRVGGRAAASKRQSCGRMTKAHAMVHAGPSATP